MVQTKRTKLTRNYRPYIAAKFYQRDIPYTFALGDGKEYDGFLNKVLEKDKKYRIFVRAVVDTPERVGTRSVKMGWTGWGRLLGLRMTEWDM